MRRDFTQEHENLTDPKLLNGSVVLIEYCTKLVFSYRGYIFSLFIYFLQIDYVSWQYALTIFPDKKITRMDVVINTASRNEYNPE